MPERNDQQADERAPAITKEDAIAEVRRWLEVDKVDPEQIFAMSAGVTLRYRDLIDHLERETEEGRLLLQAIAKGRVIRRKRGGGQSLLWPMPPGSS